jgi:hypothetical protein
MTMALSIVSRDTIDSTSDVLVDFDKGSTSFCEQKEAKKL